MSLFRTDHPHCRAVGAQPVRDQGPRPPIALHGTPEKLQRRLAIPPLRGKDLEHFTFMIDGAPEIVRLSVDPHKNFVQVPAPVRIRSMMNAPLSNPSSEHRAEPIPPESHCLVADVDATLE